MRNVFILKLSKTVGNIEKTANKPNRNVRLVLLFIHLILLWKIIRLIYGNQQGIFPNHYR